MPILVFGGTFDPPHNGHLAIAVQACEGAGAEAVWFVPAALAPLRDPPVGTPGERFDLVVAATRGNPRFAVLDIALRRGGTSYTFDTMEALRHEHPHADLRVLLGADAARTIRAWHRAEELLAWERFVVVNRTGPPPLEPAEMTALGFAASRTAVLTVESPDISASEVRGRCARGEPIDGLVPAAVAGMIAATGMYRSDRIDA